MLPPRGTALAVAAVAALTIAGTSVYTVAPGDTLSGIAQANGTTVGDIVAANALPDPDAIQAGQQLQLPGSGSPSEDQGVDVGPHAEVGAIIDRVAREHGWNPAFVKALAWQESGWDQQRVSSVGATGIMQIMPDTGSFISRHLVGRDLDLRDPEDNVLAGVVYLQHLWERTDGDPEQTLAGYYQGLRSVQVNGRYQDTERYIANVLALRERFR